MSAEFCLEVWQGESWLVSTKKGRKTDSAGQGSALIGSVGLEWDGLMLKGHDRDRHGYIEYGWALLGSAGLVLSRHS